MKKVSLIVIGAGERGYAYSQYAKNYPDLAEVVAVADPREEYREKMARDHNLPTENTIPDCHDFLTRPKFADAVIIATPDALHAEMAIAFAEKGYHLLLEKPMAVTEADCCRIIEAVEKNKILFSVCHVLRYTHYTQKIKKILNQGLIGDIVSLQHLEPLGYWHQAHSYVRGNWGNEADSSFMLLAKSCHDLDWIRYVMGVPCLQVQSFGSLKHFRKEEKPAGAGERCLDCGIEKECPYSAKKIYLGRMPEGGSEWPVRVLTSTATEVAVTEALQNGPYGRCVYSCDNDVVDHQVVNMQFEGGRTAAMTMTGFTEAAHRKTRIFGTRGELEGDGSTIRTFDFLTDKWSEIDVNASDHSILGGHGGGDYGLISSFVAALASNDPEKILSGPAETLESHRMVFAAEQSRRESRVVRL